MRLAGDKIPDLGVIKPNLIEIDWWQSKQMLSIIFNTSKKNINQSMAKQIAIKYGMEGNKPITFYDSKQLMQSKVMQEFHGDPEAYEARMILLGNGFKFLDREVQGSGKVQPQMLYATSNFTSTAIAAPKRAGKKLTASMLKSVDKKLKSIFSNGSDVFP